MLLTRFQVFNFRSVLDSGPIDIHDIIVLVGKNESGKTSILKALWKFNPFDRQPYNLDREWPRGFRKDRSEEKVVVETEFKFTPEEREQIASISPAAAHVTGAIIRKNYRGDFSYTFVPKAIEGEKDVEWVGSVLAGLAAPARASEHFRTQHQRAHSALLLEVRKSGGSKNAATALQAFKTKVPTLKDPSQPPSDQQAVEAIQKRIDEAIQKLQLTPVAREIVDTVHDWIPVFIYMDEFRAFRGSAQLDEVQGRFANNTANGEDRTVKLIMTQAGLDLEAEVIKGNEEDREQRILDMHDASQTLTNEIAERWSQKRYVIKFEADGQHFITFVQDAENSALVPLEERSKGFQWFFSFDMLFMCETKGSFKNAVILLDEPGLHLHVAAQRDLLRRLKEYAKGNQLVYTTHLPFMIDFSRPDNVYVCEEREKRGVIVHQNWAAADKDARFALQAALGMSWSQSLFVGMYNLVVEGVTDFWYLSVFSEMLREARKPGLDEDLVITPAGGASKAAYVGTLLKGQELNVAVLLDSDPEGLSAHAQLVHQWILDEDAVLLLGPVLGVKGNRCLEDLFDEPWYVAVVEKAYEPERGKQKLALPPQDGRTIVQRIEAALSDEGIKKFNKGRAGKLIMKELAGKSLDAMPATTVANFQKVIAAINAIVARWQEEQKGPTAGPAPKERRAAART